MKKWFFSNKGQVSGPLDITEAREFLASNPVGYGWHPSFNQWKPVNCISEFADIIPATEQVFLVPKEIADKFLSKKNRLQKKLMSIQSSINQTNSALGKFEKQIKNYKHLTQNLNDDVKSAINKFDKKHLSLGKKLSQVNNAVKIAEVEISDAVKRFEQRINTNEVFMPSCKVISTNDLDAPLSDKAASKAKIAQTKLATPHKRLDSEKTVAFIAPAAKKSVKSGSAEKEILEEKQTLANQSSSSESIAADTKEAKKVTPETFNGVKNIMKSVFKGDKKVKEKASIPSSKDEPLSMAERLKLAQNNSQ